MENSFHVLFYDLFFENRQLRPHFQLNMQSEHRIYLQTKDKLLSFSFQNISSQLLNKFIIILRELSMSFWVNWPIETSTVYIHFALIEHF